MGDERHAQICSSVLSHTLFDARICCGVVGPFKTSEEAEQYAKNNRPLLPADTKVVELTRPAAREK